LPSASRRWCSSCGVAAFFGRSGFYSFDLHANRILLPVAQDRQSHRGFARHRTPGNALNFHSSVMSDLMYHGSPGFIAFCAGLVASSPGPTLLRSHDAGEKMPPSAASTGASKLGFSKLLRISRLGFR